jgi:F0F1-type ATP synthase assembly protein I
MADNDDLPEVPKLAVTLPPHPADAQKAETPAKSYAKSAVASQAAGALVTPIIVLTFLGVWLDKKFNTNWITIVLVILGFIVGVASLLQILKKIAD